MPQKTQFVAGLMTTIAWLAEALYMLFLAMSTERVLLAGVDLTAQIHADAWQRALFVFLGLVCAGIIFISPTRWKLFAISSALIYLVIWYFTGTTNSTSLIEAYSLKWLTAKTLSTYVSFVLRDVLLPVCFLVVVGLTLIPLKKVQPAKPG